MSRTLLAAAIVAGSGVLGVAQSASAASIGINLGAGQTGAALAATEVAGVVPQANWNNVLTGNGTTMTSLMEDSNGVGIATAAQLWFAAGGQPWNGSVGFAVDTPDYKLMHYGLESYAMTDWPSRATMTGIPYPDYDVYVYFNAAAHKLTAGASVSLAITGGTASGAGSFFYTPMDNPSSYVVADALGGTADYAVFHVTGGSSTDSLTIKQGFALTGDKQVGLNAIQIVEAIPEPASLSLLGAGSLLLLVRRRAGNA